MQGMNGALFLNAKGLFFLSLILLAPSVALTVIFSLTTIYASLKSHKSDLRIDALNLICLLVLHVYPD